MAGDSENRSGTEAWLRLLVTLTTSLSPAAALAQPIADRFVSDAHIVVSPAGCAEMTVVFNLRARYAGHFPADHGDELRVILHPVDGKANGWLRQLHREGVDIADGRSAGVRAVTLEADQPRGPELRIQFDRPTSYEVKQSGSLDNLTIAFQAPGSNAACGALSSLSAPAPLLPGPDLPPAPPGKGVSPADMKFIEASMDEARAALKKKRLGEAIVLLKKVLKFPEHEHSAEARELLAQAQGVPASPDRSHMELEDYMLRLPEGGRRDFRRSYGADEMRPGRTPEAGSYPARAPQMNDETQFTMSGGVASSYVRDDSVNTLKDVSIAPDPSADPDAHRVHQNMFLTNFDLYGSFNSDAARSKFKISGTDEQTLQSGASDSNRYGVATAFWETAFKETDITARIGRQTRNTGGVIGRFDGGVLSWAYSDSMKLNAVAGAANWSRFDAPFKDRRFLYGASVDFPKVMPGLDTSLYAIQQTDRLIVDRQALGAEFRYFKDNKSALGTIDYDVHFGTLNAAIGNGSWTFDDKSVLSGTLDYRRVPYLSTWNALEGQPYLTLYDMLKYDTSSDVRRFALDRTPVFESGMASYARPINDDYQVIVDGTVTHLSGTPPSGEVDGTLPSGTEYYLSSQLMGQNIFTKGDMYNAAIRYAHLADSHVYFLDLNMRYPVTDEFRLNPRLRVGQRDGTQAAPTTPLFLAAPSLAFPATGLHETTVLPSVLADYSLTKDLAVEGEIGTKWIASTTGNVKSTTKDLFVTLGLRSSFSNEGSYRCAGLLAPCVGAFTAAPRGDAVQRQEKFYLAGAEPRTAKDDAPPLLLLEGGVRYFSSVGHNAYDYYADDTASLRVSRLAYSGLRANAGETFFRADVRRGLLRDVFAKGYVGGGGVASGTLYDEDFPPQSVYSKTVSQVAGGLRYGSLDLGYNVYTDPRVRLGTFIGYHGWFETVNGGGCRQTGANAGICGTPIPTGVRLVTEKDRWNNFRAGAALDVNLTERLSWNGEAALVAVSQHAQDTHYFTFGADPAAGSGTGVEAESVLKYQLTDRLNLGVGGRWWRYNTHSLDMFGQLLSYQTQRIGAFGQASYKIDFGE